MLHNIKLKEYLKLEIENIIMSLEIIKYYTDAWFKVEYSCEKTRVNFKAWEIDELNEDNPEQSEITVEPVITGFIKEDGCCEFNYKTHYCGIYKAEQFLLLMKYIYKFIETP